MRLIDADALVQALHKADTVMGQPHFLCRTVYECINKAPTINALPRWIPCEERLPREKEVVLITNFEGNVRCGQFRGTSGKRLFWIGNTLETVEAWMPLPEPYDEERKEDEQP